MLWFYILKKLSSASILKFLHVKFSKVSLTLFSFAHKNSEELLACCSVIVGDRLV